MLQRQFRLPARSHLHHPVTIRTPLFTVKIVQNNLQYSRYGFVMRKALEKSAAKRNRTRRVFRSCIEELQKHIKNGYDMLFLLERGIIDEERKTLYNDLQSLLREKGLIMSVEN